MIKVMQSIKDAQSDITTSVYTSYEKALAALVQFYRDEANRLAKIKYTDKSYCDPNVWQWDKVGKRWLIRDDATLKQIGDATSAFTSIEPFVDMIRYTSIHMQDVK